MDSRTRVELDRANQEPTGGSGSKEEAEQGREVQDAAHLVDLGALSPPRLPVL